MENNHTQVDFFIILITSGAKSFTKLPILAFEQCDVQSVNRSINFWNKNVTEPNVTSLSKGNNLLIFSTSDLDPRIGQIQPKVGVYSSLASIG